MATVDSGSEQPHVVLVSLNYQPFFEDVYADFLEKLGNRARVQRAKKSGAVIKLLTADKPPNAIICTDEAITTKEFEPAYDAILKYVREAGGTCVLMGHFPNFVLPPEMEPFFNKAGLP